VKDVIAAIVRAHPRVTEAVRGATPAQIDELERLAGLALPESYKEFLRFMGASAGPYAPLRVTRVQEAPGRVREHEEPIDISIEAVLRRYRRRARWAREGSAKARRARDPEGTVFLGHTERAQDLSWFYVALSDPARLLVAEHDSDGEKVAEAGPLASFLFARHFPDVVR